jgi:NRAMP (natural resistance-associated macrophage protein)-like metal ion transporter
LGSLCGRKRRLLRYIGPGWITGASDDDPSGIATHSQAGAQFGYGMAWVMLFTFPLMAAIQEISARIGQVTGAGIAGNIRAHYPPWLLRSIVALLLGANILNLGADLGAMGSAMHLLLAGPTQLYVAVFAFGCALLEVFSRYERYASILKWTSVSLFAYVATAFVVDIPWGQVALSTFIPSLTWSTDYTATIVAGPRHDDNTILLLLAVVRRSGGRAHRRRRPCPDGGSGRGARRDLPDPVRHLDRHGFLKSHQLVHHRHDGGNA